MKDLSLIFIGKAISQISKSLNRGNGSTWPGHIALKGNYNFIRDILSRSKTKVIVVAGTNGKTTTARLLQTGLEKNGKSVLQNDSGANLLNGVASTILLNTNTQGKLTHDYAIFEVDENALPLVLKQLTPDYLILLNLFRDQLDRYGEINTIAQKWQQTITQLPKETKLIINADDPQIAYLGILAKQSKQIVYFSLDEKNTNQKPQQAADSISCPKCGNKLTFGNVTFSHLGNWKCNNCGLKRPQPKTTIFSSYPLSGTYNKYNINAAVAVLEDIGMNESNIAESFKNFTPAFGRQEIIKYKNKQIQLFLSKNPTSFNQSFQTIKELHASTLLLILNDRIPDGRDVSWIWDTDLSGIEKFKQIIISGDRTYDMALRVQYEHAQQWNRENEKWKIEPELKNAIEYGIANISPNETLYILPTYSAMLDARKILTGKKIL